MRSSKDIPEEFDFTGESVWGIEGEGGFMTWAFAGMRCSAGREGEFGFEEGS